MSEKQYIEREAAISAFSNYLGATFGAVSHRTARTVECILKPIHAAPVREVRKGYWIGTEYDGYADGAPVYDKWECSECGDEQDGEDIPDRFYWCPNCGADMREPRNEQGGETT